MSPDRDAREARLTAALIESLHGQSEREGSAHIHEMVRPDVQARSKARLARYAATHGRPTIQPVFTEPASEDYWSEAGSAAILLALLVPLITVVWFVALALGSVMPLVSNSPLNQ